MNRQQFLAELSQYLTFITPEQRDEVLAYYYARMQQVGPEGEAALLKEIGTPMTVAITLKRRIEANESLIPSSDAEPSAPNMVRYMDPSSAEEKADSAGEENAPVSVSEDESSPNATTASPVWQPEETPAQDAEAPDVGETPEVIPEEPVHEQASPIVPDDEPVPEKEIVPEAEDEPEPIEEKSSQAAKAPAAFAPKAKAPVVQEKPKMTFGRFLLAICIALASIVSVVVGCVIAAIGGVVAVSGVDILIAGLSAADVYLSDILIVVAGGAIVLAFGVLVVWIGIWVAIKLITVMVRSFNKTPEPEKSALNVIWKIIFIIFLVLLAAGIICGCVSMFMGGQLSTLTQDESFVRMVTRLDPASYVDFFENSGVLG